jgi:hypothetical protein
VEYAVTNRGKTPIQDVVVVFGCRLVRAEHQRAMVLLWATQELPRLGASEPLSLV